MRMGSGVFQSENTANKLMKSISQIRENVEDFIQKSTWLHN